MTRIILISLVAIILGILIGIAVAWWQLRATPWAGLPAVDYAPPKKSFLTEEGEGKNASTESQEGSEGQTSDPSTVAEMKTTANNNAAANGLPANMTGKAAVSVTTSSNAATRSEGRPKAVVPKTKYEFGNLDILDTGKHTFVLRNEGTATLKITQGSSSCHCASVSWDKDEIPPGQSVDIEVKWKPESKLGGYQQQVVVNTNDPDNDSLYFSVKGVITTLLRAEPEELILSKVSRSNPTEGRILLVSTVDKPLQIDDLHFLKDDKASFLEVEQYPASEGDLSVYPNAKSGIWLRITVKSGLPSGAFQQKIQFKTNIPSRPEFAVPIGVRVVGDISIAGMNWNDVTNILYLGTVSRSEGLQQRLQIITRGPHHKEVQFKLRTSDKEPLRVSLGPTKEIMGGEASQTTLLLEIPKGSRVINHLDIEKRMNAYDVILETTHPDIPEIPIHIIYAVPE